MAHKVAAVVLSSGHKMPTIGYGTYTVEKDQIVAPIVQAVKIGCRLIDTATYYKNEDGVGEAVKEVIESGIVKREELFITTKVWPTCYSYEGVTESVNKSLSLLGPAVGYLDLVLLHWPSANDSQDSPGVAHEKRVKAWTALEDMVVKDKIKSIGVSNFAPKHLEPLLNTKREDGRPRVIPSVNQIELHLMCYSMCMEIIKCCNSHNVVVQAYSPLARGHLFKVDNKFIQKVTDLAKPSNLSYSQTLLKFLLQKGHCVVVKSVSEHRLKENFAVADATDLSKEAMQELSNIVSSQDELKKYGVTPSRVVWSPYDMN